MNGFKRSRKVLTLSALLAAGFLTGCGNSDKTEEVHSFAVWEKTDEASYIFSDGVTAEKWKNGTANVKILRKYLKNRKRIPPRSCKAGACVYNKNVEV